MFPGDLEELPGNIPSIEECQLFAALVGVPHFHYIGPLGLCQLWAAMESSCHGLGAARDTPLGCILPGGDPSNRLPTNFLLIT